MHLGVLTVGQPKRLIAGSDGIIEFSKLVECLSLPVKQPWVRRIEFRGLFRMGESLGIDSALVEYVENQFMAGGYRLFCASRLATLVDAFPGS